MYSHTLLLNILLLTILVRNPVLTQEVNVGKKVSFPETGKFLLDFLSKNKPVVYVVGYLCWNSESVVKLVKTLSSRGYYMVISTDCDKSNVRILKEHNALYVLDTSCNMTKNCIITANKEGLFRFPYKWIILDGFNAENDSSISNSTEEIIPENIQDFQNNEGECPANTSMGIQLEKCPQKFLKQISLYPDNDVVFAQRKPQYIRLFSMFKMKRSTNITVWENYGYWNKKNGIVDQRTTSVTSIRRLKAPKGPVIIGVVILNNRSLKHLEYDNERYTDALAKSNYKLANQLVDFFNGTHQYNFQNSFGLMSNGVFSGIFGEMLEDRLDIGSTPFLIQREAFPILEYVSMTTRTFVAFIFREPPVSSMDNFFLLPFQWTVWATIVGFIIVVSIVVYFTTSVEQKTSAYHIQKCFACDRDESKIRTEISDIYAISIGALAQQGTSLNPRSNAGKIAVLVLLFTMVFVYVSYSACIVSLLHKRSSRIKTLTDLLEYDIGLGVEDNIYFRYYIPLSQDPVRKKIYETKIAPPGEEPHFYSIEEGIKKVQEGKYAFHTEPGIGYEIINDFFLEEEKCGLTEITYLDFKPPWSSVSKNTPLREMVRIGMRRIQQSGLQAREFLRYYARKPICIASASFVSVGLTEIHTILIFFGIGFGLATMILIFEIFYYHRNKIPYNDTTKINSTNHIKKGEQLLHHQTNSRCRSVKVGIYGWRKRCLYILILVLMVMMIVNLALTLWILKVMDFNLDGMGQLKIVPGGLQLLGQAMVLDSLYASTFKSRRGQPITIEATRNFSIITRDDDGLPLNRLFIGNDKLECSTNSLRITDTRGVLLFSASPDAVEVGAESLKVTGQGGAIFGGSVQTPLVRASSGNQLILESPTRSLEIRAAQSIGIESRAGDITASCLTSLKLQSVAGAIRLESSSVFMPKLKSALPLPPTTAHSRDPHHHDIYQLCACANGKLFLASPHGICAAKEDSYICR